jgi:hypothetical protein
MTASNRLARVVRVAIRKDDRGVFVATSPNLKGLVAVNKDMDRLVSTIIPQAISDLNRAAGQPVVVARAEEVSEADDVLPWVAVPVEVARKALALAE